MLEGVGVGGCYPLVLRDSGGGLSFTEVVVIFDP